MRTLTTLLLAAALAHSDDKLREALKDTEPKGAWIYDDIDTGFADAKKTGRPLLVVLRCVL